MKTSSRAAMLGSVISVILAPLPSQAQEAEQARRATNLVELVQCRAITNSAERLDCFDRTAAALDSAERGGELVVLDRQQIRDTNRQLFGFQVSNPFAGRISGSAEPDVEAIETTLRSARSSTEGKWVFALADGSEWRQIDSGAVSFRNREGQEVRVRRAAMGSYMMTIGNSRAVRVRRQ